MGEIGPSYPFAARALAEVGRIRDAECASRSIGVALPICEAKKRGTVKTTFCPPQAKKKLGTFRKRIFFLHFSGLRGDVTTR